MLIRDHLQSKDRRKFDTIRYSNRHQKQKKSNNIEELSTFDIEELMGVKQRGYRRSRGSWRQV